MVFRCLNTLLSLENTRQLFCQSFRNPAVIKKIGDKLNCRTMYFFGRTILPCMETIIQKLKISKIWNLPEPDGIYISDRIRKKNPCTWLEFEDSPSGQKVIWPPPPKPPPPPPPPAESSLPGPYIRPSVEGAPYEFIILTKTIVRLREKNMFLHNQATRQFSRWSTNNPGLNCRFASFPERHHEWVSVLRHF